MKIVVLN